MELLCKKKVHTSCSDDACSLSEQRRCSCGKFTAYCNGVIFPLNHYTLVVLYLLQEAPADVLN